MTRLASVLGALAAPRVVPVRVVPRPRRADVAAMLSAALQGSPVAAEVRILARELAWRGTATPEVLREASRVAYALWERCGECAEPAAMALAVMRELLVDSTRDGAEEYDRCVRDAALTHGYIITATHEAEAVRMIQEVMG